MAGTTTELTLEEAFNRAYEGCQNERIVMTDSKNNVLSCWHLREKLDSYLNFNTANQRQKDFPKAEFMQNITAISAIELPDSTTDPHKIIELISGLKTNAKKMVKLHMPTIDMKKNLFNNPHNWEHLENIPKLFVVMNTNLITMNNWYFEKISQSKHIIDNTTGGFFNKVRNLLNNKASHTLEEDDKVQIERIKLLNFSMELAPLLLSAYYNQLVKFAHCLSGPCTEDEYPKLINPLKINQLKIIAA